MGSSMHWSRIAAIVSSWKHREGTYLTEMVIGSFFTPSIALLVSPSGTIYITVDLQGHKHDVSKSRPFCM